LTWIAKEDPKELVQAENSCALQGQNTIERGSMIASTSILMERHTALDISNFCLIRARNSSAQGSLSPLMLIPEGTEKLTKQKGE
jgi:hypothetical protein